MSESLIRLTRIYSNNFRMSFVPDKCGQMVSRTGKMIRTEGFELPEGNITDVQNIYKCLGSGANSEEDTGDCNP